MIKVTVRNKPLTDKRKLSLYLDFYPAILKEGKETRREFIKTYIYAKPKTDQEKQHNREKLSFAETLRLRRENEVNKPEIYASHEKEMLRRQEIASKSFKEYFLKLAKKRKTSNYKTWLTSIDYLNAFHPEDISFKDLTIPFIEGFRDYLLEAPSIRTKTTKISRNTASSYYLKFKAALKQAFKDGLIETDQGSRVEAIKVEDSNREFLTIEELNSLVNTTCVDPLMKKAALFSALTGLRFSDIKALKAGQIIKTELGYHLEFTQKKTGSFERQPISEQAYKLLNIPLSANKGDLVFEGLKYSAYNNKFLAQWIGAAGITKNITFHNFRHTFATLQLHYGTDIYTLSKLLGHRSLKTTQIYTKVLDQAKQEAVNKIKLNFDNE
ncbi:tyrosine-type recombinase/integrase [Sphingobacterium humi]|uniref:Tyrosine-type recombinase/integrase n=1 Tax=Sphingobacterium humi TaxID=1796905 RepID=A0A6N8KXG2_9SPHI|nr:site-specific integrase [Sphingobacterium humi]MVZ62135.1 tyrosine-type recombinase/integrase [Sphingobacterium humi]